MTDKDIKTLSDLKDEGWYWIADTTDADAQWFMAYVSGEPGEIDSEDPSVVILPTWGFSSLPEDFVEDLTDDHVFLGPVEVPDVAIPMAVPRSEKLQFQKVPVTLPSLSAPPLTKIEPAPLTKLERKAPPALVPAIK